MAWSFKMSDYSLELPNKIFPFGFITYWIPLSESKIKKFHPFLVVNGNKVRTKFVLLSHLNNWQFASLFLATDDSGSDLWVNNFLPGIIFDYRYGKYTQQSVINSLLDMTFEGSSLGQEYNIKIVNNVNCTNAIANIVELRRH